MPPRPYADLPEGFQAIELTQAIQHCRVAGEGLDMPVNSVPLVGGKRLYVRTYPDMYAASRLLGGFRELQAHVTLDPGAGNPVTVDSGIWQGAPGLSTGRHVGAALDAWLEGFHCRGRAEVTVELRGARTLGALADTERRQDVHRLARHTIQVCFRDVAPLEIHAIPVRLSVRRDNRQLTVLQAPGQEPTADLFADLADRMPVPEITVAVQSEPPDTWSTDLVNGLVDVYWRAVWTDNLTTAPYVTAVVLDQGFWPYGNTAGVGGHGVIVVPAGYPQTAAHELGHVLGRADAPCPQHLPRLRGLPRYPGVNPGQIGEWGFRSVAAGAGRRLEAIPPDAWDDMVDADPQVHADTWTSSVGYRRALRAACAQSWRRRARVPRSWRLLVEFEIANPSLRMIEAHVVETVPPARGANASDVRVVLRDDDGRVVGMHRPARLEWRRPLESPLPTPPHLPGHRRPHQYDPRPEPPHHLASLPFDSRATELAVFRGSSFLGVMRLATEPPMLGSPEVGDPLPGPSGGTERSVSWQSSTTDGSSVSHVVRYTHDGGRTHLPVVVNAPDHEFMIPMSGLPSGSDCWFEVTASAGGRSATARTPTFAHLDTEHPEPVITRPWASGGEVVLSPGLVELVGGTAPGTPPVADGDLEWWADPGGGGGPAGGGGGGGVRLLGAGRRLLIHTDAFHHTEFTLKLTVARGEPASQPVHVS